MREVVYAIWISHLEYSGLKIMDIKIGKSTDIDNILCQYSRGNRDIELLDMWTPNPDKTLSTAERGVHAVAEKYAYDSRSFASFADPRFPLLMNRFSSRSSTYTSSNVPGRSSYEQIQSPSNPVSPSTRASWSIVFTR